MKIILYMAEAANGYIAKENDETPWSEEEWESFKNIVKEVGNIIIGRRAYEIMLKNKEFDEIGNPFTVVVSSKTINDSNINAAGSPKEALELLGKEGFENALIAGGGTLNSSFMKENLIDEIYLDIEPFLFGKGIKLFKDNDFEFDLNLIEIKKLTKNTVQLHYKVNK